MFGWTCVQIVNFNNLDVDYYYYTITACPEVFFYLSLHFKCNKCVICFIHLLLHLMINETVLSSMS